VIFFPELFFVMLVENLLTSWKKILS